MNRIAVIIGITIMLSGCLIPLPGKSVSKQDQKFTVYTFKPGQPVRLQCPEWFWYAGHDQDPRWSDNYFIGWKTMGTGRTSYNAINPTQSTPIYAANLVVDVENSRATFKGFRGCYGIFESSIEVRPQIKKSGKWVNWITMNDLDCVSDNTRHNDDPNDPSWKVRTQACKSGDSNDYPIK